MFNSNIWPILSPSRHINLRNLGGLNCHLSRPPNVKCDGAKQSPYMISAGAFNSDILPIWAPLRDIGLPNLSDLDIDLSMSLRSNVITLLDCQYMVSY